MPCNVIICYDYANHIIPIANVTASIIFLFSIDATPVKYSSNYVFAELLKDKMKCLVRKDPAKAVGKAAGEYFKGTLSPEL